MSSPDGHTQQAAPEPIAPTAPPTVLPEGHEMHRVAIVVFCEAAGVDEHDAAAAARMALSATLRKAGEPDPALPSATKPSCASCGAYAKVNKKGLIKAHHRGETFMWDPEDGEEQSAPCEGTGLPPHQRNEPVVAVEYRNGHIMRARVFDTMEAGMAAGNGYLWTRPTVKAFR